MNWRSAGIALLLAGGASRGVAQQFVNPCDVTLLCGVGFPGYNRANGLSLPLSTRILLGDAIRVDPRITYRSQLGRIDPWLELVDSVGPATMFTITAGRATFTNDGWIRPAPLNTLGVLLLGIDARNYFRATRGEAQFDVRSDTGETYVSAYAGIRGEHALTVRPGPGALGGPWSVGGRGRSDRMLRVNPAIENGVTKSVIAGAGFHRPDGDVTSKASLGIELGLVDLDHQAGAPAPASRTFVQATLDASVSFPTFTDQWIKFDGHAVVSHGAPPRQRWAYLGGSGTLPTLGLLSLGGDQLIYIDGSYNAPIPRLEFPMLGPVVLALRDAIGGAAVGSSPTLHQNVGLRLSAGPFYSGFVVDPATRRRHFEAGISFDR